MMTTEQMAYETRMMTAMTTASRAGIATIAELEAVPALREEIGASLWLWMLKVALLQDGCMSIIRENGLNIDEVASDWTMRLLSPQRVKEDKSPAMERMLDMTRRTGAHTVVLYLMKSAPNACRDAYRKHAKRIDMPGYTEFGEMVIASSAEQSPEAVAVRRSSTSAMLSCLSGEFLHDVTLLGTAMKYPHKALAQCVLAGKAVALVKTLVRDVNTELCGRYEEAFLPLLRAARAYEVPAEYRENPKAMLAYMYRCTAAGSRRKFARAAMQAAA